MTSLFDVEYCNRRFGNDSRVTYGFRRFRTRWLKQSWSFDEALAELPSAIRSEVSRDFRPYHLELAERLDSEIDGASKLLFRTDDGLMIESVILRAETGRTSLCISSQVGCAAACRFCATGQMGIARNLTTEQILDQVVQANQILRPEDRRVRNIVFMGMGEPLHNPVHLHEAVAALTSPWVFAYAPQRLLVSTVGIPKEMLRLDAAFPAIKIALSLHSADQAIRQEIIPLGRGTPLEKLRETLLSLQISERRHVMIEYLMLAGKTDRDEDIDHLTRFLKDIPAHINLIPFNPIDDAGDLQSSPRETRERFGRRLKDAGFKVTIRYSLGADIAAACGQLIQQENRQIARQLHRLES